MICMLLILRLPSVHSFFTPIYIEILINVQKKSKKKRTKELIGQPSIKQLSRFHGSHILHQIKNYRLQIMDPKVNRHHELNNLKMSKKF